MTVQREYLSPNEIAELLGVSPFTIRRYIKLGELRAVKLLGGFRVHRDDLQRFLKAHEVNSGEEELSPEEATAATVAPNPEAGKSEDVPRSQNPRGTSGSGTLRAESNAVKPPVMPGRVSSAAPPVSPRKHRGAGARKPRRLRQ